MITSLLDTDLYKFTMAQVVLHHFPGATAEYEFTCRNPEVYGKELAELADELRAAIAAYCRLRFTPDEIQYLRSLRYMKDDFVHFLRLFQASEEFVSVTVEDGRLAVRIVGPWLHTIWFEVPILAMISEALGRRHATKAAIAEGERRLERKCAWLAQVNGKDCTVSVAEFGTRRRFSQAWHEKVVSRLKLAPGFVGTSNVDLARRFGLTPLGTMAHEYLQGGQALGPRLRDSQAFMLETWVKEYRGDLGIALTDVVGFKAFLADFDLYFAKLFDGCRHDSGDPFAWTEQLIAHYRALRIDPMTKQAVYSDSLDLPKCESLAKRFGKEIKQSFGIGTNLTNDLGIVAPQIVIKMVRCQGQPVAKLSDSPGKQASRDEGYLKYLRHVFNVGNV